MYKDDRFHALTAWIKQHYNESFSCQPLSGDASFRRYYRVSIQGATYIAVDSPIQHEKLDAFINVARAFQKHQLHVPHIHYADERQGFLLLSDLGDDLFLTILNDQNVHHLYQKAIATLVRLQSCREFQGWELPRFDEQHLLSELKLFIDWYLLKHLSLKLSVLEESWLTSVFKLLIKSAHEQPQVCVHRDYHSRNLLLLKNEEVGIVDFQDAVLGPVTYDLVSLLRDCYIAWPINDVDQWAISYHDMLVKQRVLQEANPRLFLKWFDFMGMQRHLKVLGIFARLFHRDGKSIYLNDIPRIVNYILQVAQKYPEFSELQKFFTTRIVTS